MPVDAPAPWKLQAHVAIGGLWAIGFAPDRDLLLAVSVNGRGVFDGTTATRLARDLDEGVYDEDTETIDGIGPLAAVRIELAGTGGGLSTRRRLPMISSDGWTVAHAAPGVFLHAPGPQGAWPEGWTRIAEVEEVRAIGFSPTGKCLVVAEPHTLHIWRRT
jgi:hypothetical protein